MHICMPGKPAGCGPGIMTGILKPGRIVWEIQGANGIHEVVFSPDLG